LLKEEKNRPEKANGDITKWSESPWLIIKGFLMGSADIVPGVSGGTMALITGVYNRLIFAIKSVDATTIRNTLTLRFRKVFEHFHWKFLLLLFTGIVMAVIFFTRIVPLQVYMFTHPEIVYGLFFGLIVGSIFLLLGEVEKPKRNLKGLIPLAAGALFGFWIVTMVPADTPETFWFVFLSGAVSICAMILPGISGSYILLILRKYDYILSQLGQIGSVDTFTALLNLLPFILGAIIGLASFARLLSWLIRHYYAVTLLILIGFLVGSLYVIWPWQDRVYDEAVRNVQVMTMSDPLVQELLEQDEPQQGPRYLRIGRVVNPDATFEQFRRVEVETVSRRLVSSDPYFPTADVAAEKESDVKGGVAGMVIGLLLIGAISYLRRKGASGAEAVDEITGG
jgi:putative membrane protein